jgi:hypothetical protein
VVPLEQHFPVFRITSIFIKGQRRAQERWPIQGPYLSRWVLTWPGFGVLELGGMHSLTIPPHSLQGWRVGTDIKLRQRREGRRVVGSVGERGQVFEAILSENVLRYPWLRVQEGLAHPWTGPPRAAGQAWVTGAADQTG